MRCVFDTNVLVSALLLSDSKPRKALDFALRTGRIAFFCSPCRALPDFRAKKFRRYVDEEDVRVFLATLTLDPSQWQGRMCDAIPMSKKKPSDQQAHDRRHQERMRAKKQAKKPRREDVNQAAARIVREATEKG